MWVILTKKVPRSPPEEFTFGDLVLVLENILQVLRALDHDSGRERRHRDLIRLESESGLTFHEPVEEYVSWLEERDGIAKNR